MYSHILNDDRRKIAELFAEAFYEIKNLNPQMYVQQEENRVRKQVKNPCEACKIKASQILHKIISTHLLTVLTNSVIFLLEQEKSYSISETKVPEVLFQE